MIRPACEQYDRPTKRGAVARALDQAAAIVDWANTVSLNVAIHKDRYRERWFIQNN
jgi:hypothetical protein